MVVAVKQDFFCNGVIFPFVFSQVQNNKQVISALKRKSIEGINDLRPPDNNNRINARWTNDELLLAVQGQLAKTQELVLFVIPVEG